MRQREWLTFSSSHDLQSMRVPQPISSWTSRSKGCHSDAEQSYKVRWARKASSSRPLLFHRSSWPIDLQNLSSLTYAAVLRERKRWCRCEKAEECCSEPSCEAISSPNAFSTCSVWSRVRFWAQEQFLSSTSVAVLFAHKPQRLQNEQCVNSPSLCTIRLSEISMTWWCLGISCHPFHRWTSWLPSSSKVDLSEDSDRSVAAVRTFVRVWWELLLCQI